MQVNDLIRIQSIGRTFLAKKKLKQIREDKLKTLFSTYFKQTITNLNIGSNRARRDSYDADAG